MDDAKLETLKKIIKPFISPGELRSEADLLLIEERIKQVKFIEELTKEYNSRQFMEALCRSFTVEVLAPYERLITFGELNFRFFIVLYGSLKILVPEFKSAKDMTQKDMKDSLARRLSLPQTSFLNFKLTKDRNLVLKLKELLGQKPSIVRRNTLKFDMDYLKKLGTISVMKEKSKLLSGDSYGEQCLTSEKPRDSTAETREVTVCLSLEKETFLRIKSEEEDRRIKERSFFLQKLPIFASLQKKNIMKIVQYFSVHNYVKNQLVYRDKMPADCIYFIETGEFQLSKTHNQSVKKIIEGPLGFVSSHKSLLKIENAREIKYTQSLQVAIRGRLEMLGYEEYLSKSALRTHTCKCISPSGTLYAIKTHDFKQRVNDPESINFLNNRYKFDVDHENHISTAGSIVSKMHRSESKPSAPDLTSFGRGKNYMKILIDTMHVKRKNHVKSCSTTQSPLYCFNFDKSPKDFKKNSQVRIQSNRFMGKTLEESFIKAKERIKRVPPPNFMTGIRDMNRSYDKSFRADNSTRRTHNLSSIY
ncbi:hypothetical protein SteCoe_11386 [Stentor coeruleus]|uniref:Cyclic nucleotide-binding domain-containing protein n=1 Tax=Stentor coeruleus TaxID=5963 RepID=A0A1R2CDA3_9CILI|nr:hypothetical protein SteCoe_11386 [Stentor coeruleus]